MHGLNRLRNDATAVTALDCARMSNPPPSLPAGVRDFLPRAAARRRGLADAVMAVFDSWGYSRIVTPAFEVADVLERGLGKDARAAAIRFVEPGTGQIVALRPDITPQVARVVATRMRDVPRPLRLSYEGAVMRMTTGYGQRELVQAGIELMGAQSPDGDAEVLALASAVLRATRLPDVALARLDVGHVAPVKFVIAACDAADGVTDGPTAQAVTAALARKDRAGLARAASGLAPTVAKLAQELATLWGSTDEVFARVWGQSWPDEVAVQLSELRTIIAAYQQLAKHPIEVGSTSAMYAALSTTPPCGLPGMLTAPPRLYCAAAVTMTYSVALARPNQQWALALISKLLRKPKKMPASRCRNRRSVFCSSVNAPRQRRWPMHCVHTAYVR